MQSIDLSRQGLVAAIAAAGAVLLLWVSPVGAAASVYPPGGGAFATDAEGWQATEATCNIPLSGLCSASGGHDSAAGNPAGSLAAEAEILLNLGGLFESTVNLVSPDFTVAEDGPAVVHLDRQFEPGGLIALVPEATYTVDLIDRDSETPTHVLTETLGEGDASFAGEGGVASVAAGHAYALSIEVEIGSTTASLGLMGSAVAHFDNVALTTEGPSGEEDVKEKESDGRKGGGSGEAGGSTTFGGLDASELRTLVRRGDAASAGLSGKRVFVRVRCPMRVEHACRITAQGRIKKRVRVTQRRTVRVANGRSRLVALRVKPRFREKVARRKRLLIVQKVRVGNVSTTFARSRTLVRRG